jgi:hypothetical protein
MPRLFSGPPHSTPIIEGLFLVIGVLLKRKRGAGKLFGRNLEYATDDAITTTASPIIVKSLYSVLLFYYLHRDKRTYTIKSPGKISILYCCFAQSVVESSVIPTENQYQ